MPKVLLKDILVEIRHSLGRFCSILAIVALGVAFFAGIKASAPDMKYSADQYFDKYNLQDIQIYSTLGLDEADVKAIAAIPGVNDVQPVITKDFLVYRDSSELVFKVFSLPDTQNINTVRLTEGRMPANDTECLIEADSVNNKLFKGFSLGQTITLESGTKDPVSDVLKRDTFTIVGKCYTPYYLSYEKGTSSIGSGEVSSFLFIPDSAFDTDYYTEIDVSVEGAQDLNTYSDAYFDLIDPVVDKIEAIAQSQINRRIQIQQDKVDDARNELEEETAKGQKEIDEGKEKLETEEKKLADAKKQLEDAKKQLDDGWQAYNNGIAQIDENLPAINSGIAQIQSSLTALPGLQSQLTQVQAGLNEIAAQKSTLQENIDQLNQAIASLQEAQAQLEQIEAALQNPELAEEQRAQLEAQKAQLEAVLSAASIEELQTQLEQANTGMAQLDAKNSELLASRDQLNAGIAKLQQAQVQLESLQATQAQLLAGQSQLQNSLKELNAAQKEYEDGLAQYTDGMQQLKEGKQELADAQKELDEKKADALKEIEEAQAKVDDLDGKWIVLDRNSHYSYRDYGACADRMDGIASVFPVFFFLVAALVCMTTMTRMVDEERTQIGTLKALGYSRYQIAGKYLIYALLASVLGSILGCAIGMAVFPWIIFYAWNTMYNIETIRYAFQPGLMLLASGSVTGVVLLATIYSIYKELQEVPSQLMRPKAGKAGKKIFLEKIPWLWNRVPFLHKVTLRNIFLYKRRFFMTVIGIAGCSALLVAGFGINDSISDIVNLQFHQIYHYDASMLFDAEEAEDNIAEKAAALDGVEDVYEEDTFNVTLETEDKEQAATVHVISDPQGFRNFTTLKSITSGTEELVEGDGVWINEKMAQKMHLEAGDTFTFTLSDDSKITTTVLGVYENYVNHHIYVSEDTFQTWNTDPDLVSASLLIKTSQTDEEFEASLGKELMAMPGVKSVTFYSSLQENFLNMIGSIKMVVVVLVASAAALAFVVLYNLSNVNISERMREIATIKVLGFTEKEVNAYVNRESLLLAFFGCLLGLWAGIYLHSLIMSLAELDDVMFGRTISLQSYIISFILTIAFALIINWIMKFKLRRIEMVESLKAVE